MGRISLILHCWQSCRGDKFCICVRFGFTSWNSGRLCSSSLLNFGVHYSLVLSKSEWSLTGSSLALTISAVYALS